MARVLMWKVPIDDLPHDVGGGEVVHIGNLSGEPDVLQIWTKEEDVDKAHLYRRDVQVIVGAHPFPNNAAVLGSHISGRIIYHLIEFT